MLVTYSYMSIKKQGCELSVIGLLSILSHTLYYTCIAYIYSINPCTLFLMLMHFIFQTSNFANPKHSAVNVKKSKKKDSERTLLINHSDDEDI